MKEIVAERANLFDPNMMIAFSFDIVRHKANYLEIQRAIKLAFEGDEMTMSKVVLLPTGQAYFDKMQKSGCKVEQCFEDFDSLMIKNENCAFDIEQGELMRVFIQMTDAGAAVLILAHHLAGDGKSLTYFIQRVMSELSGVKCDKVTEDKLPAHSFKMTQKAYLPYVFKGYAKGINRKWQKSKIQFDLRDRQKCFDSYWQNRHSVVLKERLSLDQVEQLKIKAKSIKVTLNSLLLTALMKFNSRYKSVGLAVNVRDTLDLSMSNQVSGISVKYSYNDKLSFERNAKILHKKIYNQLNSNWRRYFIMQFIPQFTPSLIDAALMASCGLCDNKIALYLAKTFGYIPINANTSLSVTNLTQLNIQDTYGEYQIKNLCFIPPVVSYTYQTFGVATFYDGMSITFHALSNRMTQDEGQAFIAAVQYCKNNCQIK